MLMPVFLSFGDHMSKALELVGKRFGRLTVVKRLPNNRWGQTRWECRCECGSSSESIGIDLRQGKTKSCGCISRERVSKTGDGHPAWKGGRYTSNEGYILIRDSRHSNSMKGGYILEHVKVMSDHLRRPLTKDETVHHKNGIRNDNRIENLELWSSRHPKGQQVSYKVEWAKEILRLYEPEALA